MSVFDELIFDRSAADVSRWNTLRKKGWQAMSDEERAEWMATMKGSYNYTDMNRVELAVAYLADRLTDDGYPCYPKTNWFWGITDKPLPEDWDRYYGNVRLVRETLPAVFPTTPVPITRASKLNYEAANDLEKILADVNTLVNSMEYMWLYSNDIFCGEV